MKTVEEILFEIGNLLLKTDVDRYGFEGRRGIALFLLLFSRYNNYEKYYDKSIVLIEQELSYFSNHLDNPTFWSGLAGLGWYCNTIVKQYVDSKYDAGFAAIDELLENQMLNCNYSGLYYYDHLYGSLGIGHYFLSATKKAAIASLVEKLDSTTIDDNYTLGKKWKTNINHLSGCWDYNISLSHGMSSIVIMLSKIYQQGIKTEKCATLIEGAVNYILAQKLPIENSVSIFGNCAIESMKHPCSSRLSWCYGDLGIAVALWRASQVLNRSDWEAESRAILLHASKRRKLNNNHVLDACFCHGTSGIAHIFNRMWKETGIPECRDTAIYWINQTINMANFEDGFAGFKTWQGTERGFQGEYGLLGGIAGIGLALLSYISDDIPIWDECLLLN